MTPNELLNTHRYAEAVEAYRQEIRDQPDKNLYDGIGQAFLALRKFDEALESFRRNNEIQSGRLKGSFPSLNKAGAALWLMGKRGEALSEWHRATAGILDGSIRYGDLAGGGTQGLLLWYGAVTLKDGQERDHALEYLRNRAKRKAYAAICWPRPIVLMVLGEKSFTEVLETGCGSPVLSECLENAATDLLKRRQLCQSLFYAACQERQAGNEAECIKKMRLCSQLENPIIESEWYLARDERE
jgi:tetratricopeptide (TPR) repeat protein